MHDESVTNNSIQLPPEKIAQQVMNGEQYRSTSARPVHESPGMNRERNNSMSQTFTKLPG